MAINGNYRKNSRHAGRQLHIRDQLALDPTDYLKIAMAESLKNCQRSREQVVDEINRLAVIAGITTEGKAQKISVAVLDKWVARSAHAHIIPTRYLPIFCQVTGSLLPLQALMPASFGAEIVSAEDAALLQWARVEQERRRLQKQSKHLAREAGIE
ncbi:MAG: hypothetical protein LLF99_06810 [Desulfobacteraceae bacterium]|nr:hypothetical protein [Desulfobacteraceae bacterium]